MISLSVVICTFNPRKDHLLRTFEGLRRQSLNTDEWELLVVDNASSIPVADSFDLAWHRNARVLREDRLGISFARVCGLRATKSDLFVFVDDDNILNPNYLEESLRIGRCHPNLGAWGGTIEPEYEIPVPPELAPYMGLLAIRKVSKAAWSNAYNTAVTPYGAGMTIRRSVMEQYINPVREKQLVKFGRKGLETFFSCEDTDMAWCAIDIGLGCGVFPELILLHLIPQRRISESYLLKIQEGTYSANYTLHRQRGVQYWRTRPMSGHISRMRFWLKFAMATRVDRSFALARIRGEDKAAIAEI